MASLSDIHLIEKARHFAEKIFDEDPELLQPENQYLAERLHELWHSESSDIS
jgi:hypothetical protein